MQDPDAGRGTGKRMAARICDRDDAGEFRFASVAACSVCHGIAAAVAENGCANGEKEECENPRKKLHAFFSFAGI